jgi:hypothetical protein
MHTKVVHQIFKEIFYLFSSIDFIDTGSGSIGSSGESSSTSGEASWESTSTSWETSWHASWGTSSSVEFGHDGIPQIFDFLSLSFISFSFGILVSFQPFDTIFNSGFNLGLFFW